MLDQLSYFIGLDYFRSYKFNFLLNFDKNNTNSICRKNIEMENICMNPEI